jgi:DNA-binding NarL/FixJ family response regulator
LKRITVLLVEDHTIVREGLRKMLEVDAELRVVDEGTGWPPGHRLGPEAAP